MSKTNVICQLNEELVKNSRFVDTQQNYKIKYKGKIFDIKSKFIPLEYCYKCHQSGTSWEFIGTARPYNLCDRCAYDYHKIYNKEI